ncbi:MAG: hypothetical protein KC414_10895, partial [Romboutsia sp.]|nr:hypothetical protein [Romboutsia sp.]
WLNSLDWKKCYNISKFANGGDTISNHPNKKIILDKIVKNLENNRNNIKPKYKDKNGNWKGGISITNCLNCNKVIRTPSKLCSECFHKQKNYTKNRNPFYNKRHTKETKELMSKKRKKEGYMGGQEKAVVIDGNEYKSVSEASRQLKVVPNTIINRIRNEKFSTYKYKEIC